jgi:hypothetical protein
MIATGKRENPLQPIVGVKWVFAMPWSTVLILSTLTYRGDVGGNKYPLLSEKPSADPLDGHGSIAAVF